MSSDSKSAVLSGQWAPSLRYPDPLITALDPRFKQYQLPLASVERLYTGTRWSEGPVWFGDTRSLIWSDVPGDCMYRWDEETGTSRRSASHRTTATAIPATAREGSSPASTSLGASPAPNMTAPSP